MRRGWRGCPHERPVPSHDVIPAQAGIQGVRADVPITHRIPACAGMTHSMDVLFILIPLSVVLALAILAALGWAVWRGQFDGIEAEGERILHGD
jgi:cbb3-type cytochrome oxidase maturation protein